MDKCTECLGEGLVHQGESIHKVCEKCSGTGKVGELSATETTTMEEENVPTEESSLSDSGEVAEGSSEESEASAE